MVFAASLFAAPISQGERDFALSSLHASRKAFLDSIAGLSEAQWKFKPAPDRWSVAETAEHIVLTEQGLLDYGKKVLASPAVEERKVDRSVDQAILKRMTDRSQKRKNPAELTPTGRFATPDDAARAFKESRDRALDYARTTQDDLRSHVMGSGPEAVDAYQMLILFAGHTDRHVAQINEVKANPNYPRK